MNSCTALDQAVSMVNAVAERLILVIDANPEHIRVVESTFQESQGSYRMVAIAQGSEALDFLFHRGAHETASRPDLVLLDLNLPDTDGFDMLAAMKADSSLRRIPTIVFTSSNQAEHIFRSYALQGNCYVLKTEDLDSLAGVVKRIEEFWLGIVTLPGE